MTNTMKVKRSSVSGKIPTVGQLTAGEFAINTTDEKAFFSSGTSIIELARAGSSVTSVFGRAGVVTVTQSDIITALGYTPYNASNPSSYITGNQNITLSGDVSGSGTTAITTTLANSGVTAGTYNNSATQVRPFTVDAKGRVTGIGTAVTIAPAFSSIASKPTTIAGYGITDHSLATCTDATISAPTNGQLLQWNGTKWVNASTTPASATGLLSTWTLVAGNRYYADFTHGLGTSNLVVQLFDNTTNALVQADSVVISNTTFIRVTVIGNTKTLRIVAVANGQAVGVTTNNTAVVNGGGAPSIIEDLFANRPAASTVGRIFISYDTKVIYRDTGTTWDIVSASSGTIKTYTYYANSLDSPNTSDFAVNVLAPVISDSLNTAMNVRSFSNTVEQGVGLMLPVPVGATTITFDIRGRAATAPASATTVTHKLYTRKVPNNAVMPSWSAGTTFTALTVPTNNYYQKYSQSYSLATLGLLTGETYHFELTRITGGLAFAWLVVEIAVVFT